MFTLERVYSSLCMKRCERFGPFCSTMRALHVALQVDVIETIIAQLTAKLNELSRQLQQVRTLLPIARSLLPGVVDLAIAAWLAVYVAFTAC